MKLKEGFILHNVGEQHMVVAVGEAGKVFSGMIRNNAPANRIFQLLMEETSEEKIVDTMFAEYDAPREQIAEDVHEVIEQIRKEGFLDE